MLTFTAMKGSKPPFEKNLISAFVRTSLWSVGEIDERNFRDLSRKELHDDDLHEKFELILGKLIVLAFLFLFVIVLMNLFNAVALGDVQVIHISIIIVIIMFKSYIPLDFLQKLREDAICIRNKKKIEVFIQQLHGIETNFKFKNIQDGPQPHSKNWFIQKFFLDQVYVLPVAQLDCVMIENVLSSTLCSSGVL